MACHMLSSIHHPTHSFIVTEQGLIEGLEESKMATTCLPRLTAVVPTHHQGISVPSYRRNLPVSSGVKPRMTCSMACTLCCGVKWGWRNPGDERCDSVNTVSVRCCHMTVLTSPGCILTTVNPSHFRSFANTVVSMLMATLEAR